MLAAYYTEFHATRDYFECHEILEEHWKATGQNDEALVILIQISVALYHWRRGNYRGAKKSFINACQKFEHADFTPYFIDDTYLMMMLEQALLQLEDEAPAFRDWDLPLQPDYVATLSAAHETWGLASDMQNELLIHKHTLRDRSDVITARTHALQQKR